MHQISRRAFIASGCLAMAGCARTGDFKSFAAGSSDSILVGGFRALDHRSSVYRITVGLVKVDPETLEHPGNALAMVTNRRSYLRNIDLDWNPQDYAWDQGPAGTYVLHQIQIDDITPMYRPNPAAYAVYKKYIFRFGNLAEDPGRRAFNFRVDTIPGKANYIGDFVFRIQPSTLRTPLRASLLGVESTYPKARVAFPEMTRDGIEIIDNPMVSTRA